MPFDPYGLGAARSATSDPYGPGSFGPMLAPPAPPLARYGYGVEPAPYAPQAAPVAAQPVPYLPQSAPVAAQPAAAPASPASPAPAANDDDEEDGAKPGAPGEAAKPPAEARSWDAWKAATDYDKKPFDQKMKVWTSYQEDVLPKIAAQFDVDPEALKERFRQERAADEPKAPEAPGRWDTVKETAQFVGGKLVRGLGSTVSGQADTAAGIEQNPVTGIGGFWDRLSDKAIHALVSAFGSKEEADAFIQNLGGAQTVASRMTQAAGEKAGGAIKGAGDKIVDDALSDWTKNAMAGSQAHGSLDPRTWSFGDNPSLRGYAMNTIGALSEMVGPYVAGAAVGGAFKAAQVGSTLGMAAQGGDMSAEQARGILDAAAKEPPREGGGPGASLLEQQSPAYRGYLAQGLSPDDAKARLALEVGAKVAPLGATIMGVGGVSIRAAAKPAAKLAPGLGPKATGAAQAMAAMGEAGALMAGQEAGTTAATNAAAGTDADPTKNVFGNFASGATLAAPFGVVGGIRTARRGVPEKPAAPPPQASAATPDVAEARRAGDGPIYVNPEGGAADAASLTRPALPAPPLAGLAKRAVDRFRESNPDATRGMGDNEVLAMLRQRAGFGAAPDQAAPADGAPAALPPPGDAAPAAAAPGKVFVDPEGQAGSSAPTPDAPPAPLSGLAKRAVDAFRRENPDAVRDLSDRDVMALLNRRAGFGSAPDAPDAGPARLPPPAEPAPAAAAPDRLYAGVDAAPTATPPAPDAPPSGLAKRAADNFRVAYPAEAQGLSDREILDLLRRRAGLGATSGAEPPRPPQAKAAPARGKRGNEDAPAPVPTPAPPSREFRPEAGDRAGERIGEAAPPAPERGVPGREDQVVRADGARTPVRYHVVDAAEVVPSHAADGTPNSDYAQGVADLGVNPQNRDRGDKALVAQVNSIAAKPDYLRVGPSRDLGSGAPVVAEGEGGKLYAVAGNGRTAGLQEAYRRGTAEDYRRELVADAPNYGADPGAVAKMRQPMLVRVMPRDAVTRDIGDVSNRAAQAAQPRRAQAFDDAQRLKGVKIEFRQNEDGDLHVSPQSVADFVRAMPEAERAGMVNERGAPLPAARDRLVSSILADTYGSETLVRAQAEDLTGAGRNVVNGLAAAALTVREIARDLPEFSKLYAQAAESYLEGVRSGLKPDELARQADIEHGDALLPLMRFFADNRRSGRAIGDGIARHARRIREAIDAAKKDDMFGSGRPAPDAKTMMGWIDDGAYEVSRDAGRSGASDRVAERRAADSGGSGLDAEAASGGRGGTGRGDEPSAAGRGRAGPDAAGAGAEGSAREEVGREGGRPVAERMSERASDLGASGEAARRDDGRRASRVDDAAERNDFLSSVLPELGSVDDLFQNPRVKARTVQGALREVDPSIRYRGDATSPEEARESGAERKLMFETKNGHDFYVFERGDELWIDVSRLTEGEAGSRIYAGLMDYAANARKVFIGDPAGLSDIALRRRTDAMLSSAIKRGSTDHMEPHERQIEGDKSLGVPPLDWRSGDTAGNIRHLIDVSTRSLFDAVPEARDARYDFKTGTFRTGGGERLSDGIIQDWADAARGTGAPGVGSATLKRGILLNSLAHVESGERPGLLEQALRQPDQLVGEAAKRTFYRRDARSGNNAADLTAELRRNPDAAKALDAGRVKIVQSADEIPGVHGEGIAGYYDGERAYLVADAIKPGEAFSVFLHEVGAHHGLKRMIGGELYGRAPETIRKAAEGRGPATEPAREAMRRAEADAQARGERDRKIVDDETVAYFVEAFSKMKAKPLGPMRALYDRIVAQAKTFLSRQLGITRDLTPEQIFQSALGAARRASWPVEEGARWEKQGRDEGGRFSRVAQAAPGEAGYDHLFTPTSWGDWAKDKYRSAQDGGWKTWIREHAIDFNARVGDAMGEIGDRLGSPLSAERDVYKQKRLYAGKVEARKLDFAQNYIDPLVKAARDGKLSRDDINDYLYAKHAPERNAWIKARSSGKGSDAVAPIEGGSGISNERAAAVLARLEGEGKGEALRKVGALVQDMRRETIKTLEDGGLLSKEQAAEWRKMKDWVPLRGWDNPLDALDRGEGKAPGSWRAGGAGASVRGKEAPEAKGRKTLADDPLSTMVDMSNAAIERAEKNHIGRTAWDMFRSLPEGMREDFVKLDKGEAEKVVDPKTGTLIWKDKSPLAEREKVMSLKIDGETHHIVFDDRKLAEAFNRMSADELPTFFKPMAKLISIYKSMWLHANPEFLLDHFLFRYPIEAAANAYEFGPGAALRSLRSYPIFGSYHKAVKAMNAMTPAERAAVVRKVARGEGTKVEKYQAYYQEMRDAGGLMHFNDMAGIDRIKSKMDDALAQFDRNPARASLAWARDLGHAMTKMTNAMDNAQRLAAYIEARQRGESRSDAAMKAREATVDFALKGSYGNWMTALMDPMSNTAAQSAARMVNAGRRSQNMRRLMLGMVKAGALVTLYNYFAGGEDKDGTPNYEKIGEWNRRLKMQVMTPGWTDDKGRPNHLQFAMPYNYAGPFNVGISLAQLGLKSAGVAKEGTGHIVGQAFKAMLEALTPFGKEEDLVMKAVPYPARSFVRVKENTTTFGGPVHTPFPTKGVAMAEQGNDGTGEGWKMLARGVNAATGGSKYKPGGIDFAPEDYREVFNDLAGTFTGLISRTATTASNAGTPDAELKDTPFLRRVAGGGAEYDTADRQKFYEEKRRVQSVEASYKAATKAGDLEAAKAIKEQNADVFDKVDDFKEASKSLKAEKKKMRAVLDDPASSDEAKRSARRAFKAKQREAMFKARGSGEGDGEDAATATDDEE